MTTIETDADGAKWFRWVCEFRVRENWVEDGFELDDESASEMLAEELSFAHGGEMSAKVIDAPDQKEVRKMQGYED